MTETYPIPTNPRFQDLTGKRFGRLVVLSFAGMKKHKSCWNCKCDCGQMHITVARSLIRGRTKSCGCWHKEAVGCRSYRHGGTGTAEYRIWGDMIRRCTSPSTSAYKHYGGRGITVCDRWRKSFPAFLEDMGLRPSAKHSIDRVNNDGNYEKSNCRWSTQKEQMRNKRTNRLLTFKGRTAPLVVWAEEYKINAQTLRDRIVQWGWTTERALTEPVHN